MAYFQSNVTSTVSVALVLVLLGVIAFMALAARTMNRTLKENIGFCIVMAADADSTAETALQKRLAAAPYAAKVTYVSKQQALEQWSKDTGEDLMATFGVNPFSAEFQVNVKAAYATTAKLKQIRAQLQKDASVEEVELYEAEVDTANNNIRTAAIVLLAVALLLVLISIALINNTVRLTVYSRRFLIHTMKLVGAKPGFIRRPFVAQFMLVGLIAAVVASLILVAGDLALKDYVGNLTGEMWTPLEIVMVFAALVVAGVVICSVAAFFAAGKYIRMNYDDLFKR